MFFLPFLRPDLTYTCATIYVQNITGGSYLKYLPLANMAHATAVSTLGVSHPYF